MKHPKFTIGQKVWALRDVGRWGEPTGVRGTIINVIQSLTAGNFQYTIKKDTTYSDDIIQVWEDQLSEMNQD